MEQLDHSLEKKQALQHRKTDSGKGTGERKRVYRISPHPHPFACSFLNSSISGTWPVVSYSSSVSTF